MARTWRQRWRLLRRSLTRGVVWDLFMVYLALVNLGLILFDLTYLWLRPFYLSRLPIVTRIYDPVKGIEPEPVTRAYLDLVDRLSDQVTVASSSRAVNQTLAELVDLSAEIIDDNPFERSGLERNRIRLFFGFQHELAREGVPGVDEMEALELARIYWSRVPAPERLASRIAYFDSQLAPLLEVNYFRRYSPSGDLTDHFWRLDLPFLTIFIIEFFTRWYLAVRRRTYPRWFFFPIFNWYDLLGIVPLKEFRLFRLFRIVSIYVRLSRSEHSIVGADPFSRLVKYFANIITEEISDMVALRILNETQEELQQGTHRRIIRTVAATHRDALARQLARQSGRLASNPEVRRRARGFLDANLEQAIASADALRRLPIPDFLLQPLVEVVGRALFDALADTLAATLSTEEGQRVMEAIIVDAIDGLIAEVSDGELERIVREVSIEILGHMKQTVAVRKWALPDQPRRSVFTRDLVD